MTVKLGTEVELKKEHENSTEYMAYPRKKLRVYLDYENQKYFIDMAAAFALKLITYTQWIANEKGYYEITSYQLNEYSKMFEIVYEYFDVVIKNDEDKNKVFSVEDIDYNRQDKIKFEINNLKDLREDLLKSNQYANEEDYKVQNENDNLIAKK